VDQQLIFDIEADELQIFVEEVNEHLQTIETGILCLEQGASSDTLHAIFRGAHTLKALAGTVGHQSMADLTHTMETLFDGMRQDEVTPTRAVVDDLLAAVDVLKALRDEIITRQPSGVSADSVLERLRAALGGGGAAVPQSPVGGSVPALPGLDADQSARLEAYRRQGCSILHIEVTTRPDAFAPAARLSQAAMGLMELGEVIFQKPSMAELARSTGERHERLVAILATEADRAAVEQLLAGVYDLAERRVQPFFETAEGVAATPLAAAPGATAVTTTPPPPASRGGNGDQPTSVARPATPAAAEARGDRTVRISVDRLDTLMNLVGELITDRNRLLQIEQRLHSEYGRSDSVSALGEMTTHVDRVVDQLQEEVMRARMVPIAQLFSKFPRIVRDVARISGKEVNFIIEGEATELDRTLIESIGDPLIHLLRNAVDHGLESPADRRVAGKPTTGTVRLTAAHEEGHIVITVSDDGRGIDPARIRQSALKRGIVTEEEIAQLDDDQVIDLIFRPSLSTAERVSELSGRGVGLDVVRTNVEKLSGSVVVESELGRGTTFQVTLPLTLAIVDTMLIALGDSVYALPLASIIESLYLSDVQISTVRSKPTIRWRDSVLPLLDLREYFARPPRHGKNGDGRAGSAVRDYHKPAIVTVGWGRQRVGLIVDGIIGKQGIVVKSLSSIVGEVPGILGCAILGDGRVALIVDIPGLISAAFHTRRQGV
jgi:two-component system chemotaxis sensor kinase CheA